MKFFLKLICAVFCALLLWEIILSISVIKIPGNYKHPELGKIYKKGLIVSGQEGYSITHINSLGMRNDEIHPKKPNEIRIAVLGDSYTMALQVGDKNIFTNLLSQYLNSDTIKGSYNIINAGVLGYSPANYLYLSDFYNKNLNPDYYIIQLNDDDFCRDMVNQNTHINVIKQGGSYKLKINNDFISENPLKVMFSQLNDLTVLSTFRLGAEKIQEMLKMQRTDSAENVDKNKDYSDLINWTIKSLKSKYKNIVILYLPGIDYEKPDKAPSKIEQQVKMTSEEYNVDFIDMRDSFVDYYKNTSQPVSGFNNTKPGTGHINKTGHKLVAEKLTEYFNRKQIK